MSSEIGLVGLAVMGQNLALNVATKGFKISVFNRSYEKTEACVTRAGKEGLADNLTGFKEMGDFVQSLQKPRRVIILVQVRPVPTAPYVSRNRLPFLTGYVIWTGTCAFRRIIGALECGGRREV
jgi:6-phosphogluconate dehydrogenase